MPGCDDALALMHLHRSAFMEEATMRSDNQWQPPRLRAVWATLLTLSVFAFLLGQGVAALQDRLSGSAPASLLWAAMRIFTAEGTATPASPPSKRPHQQPTHPASPEQTPQVTQRRQSLHPERTAPHKKPSGHH